MLHYLIETYAPNTILLGMPYLKILISVVGVVISGLGVFFSIPAVQQITFGWFYTHVNYEQKILTTDFVGKLFSEVYIQSPFEHSLSELIGHEGSQYIVVVGPKCCGKSTLVNHVIAANPIGVIPISMSSTKRIAME